MTLDPPCRDEIVTALSTEITRIHARCFGCNPSRASTVWHEDCVVCVLDGVLTAPERTLVDAGRFDRVDGDRQALRTGLEPTFRALVETLTGHPVRAYLTEICPADCAFEAFVLEESRP